MKKYYILAFTFLSLLLGQSSYAQNYSGDYTDEDLIYGGNSLLHGVPYTDSDPHQDEILRWETEDGHLVIVFENEDGEKRIQESYYDPDSQSLVFSSRNLDDPESSWEVIQFTIPPDEDYSGGGGGDDTLTFCDWYPEYCNTPGTGCQITGCQDGYDLVNCECVKRTVPTCIETSCPAGYIFDRESCGCVCATKAKGLIANNVYDTLNGSQEFGEDPVNSPNVSIVDPYILPPNVEFTKDAIGFNSALYKVTNTDGSVEYVYATEGSTLQFQDWLNNGQQGTGHFAEQYKLSVDNAKALAIWAADNHVTLSFTGHSLGGGLANANALATGLHATIFNPAGLHDNTINDPLLGLNLGYQDKVDYYVNLGEIVDIANGLMGTPARGNRHEIGRDPVVTAAIWYSSTWAGVAYSGYLHTMGSLLDVLDCD